LRKQLASEPGPTGINDSDRPHQINPTSLRQIAQEFARQNPTAITGLFVSSLNEMIDVSQKRLTALENRIPPTIWLLLLLIAFLTCFTFGYWSAEDSGW
jgi:hypothetical protein